jgi:hypothetical protein
MDYAYDLFDIYLSSFPSANRYLSNFLLRKARRIHINTTREKWRKTKEQNILQLIDNPYYQLSITSEKGTFLDISEIVSLQSRVSRLFFHQTFPMFSQYFIIESRQEDLC